MSKGIVFKSNNELLYACPYFPIGSIYLSVSDIDPGTIFGGKWERIKDRFLLGAGDTYKVGNTGGSTSHTHNYSHTHASSGTHSHSLSDNGRACIHHSGGYFWFRELSSSITWQDTAKASATGLSSSTNNSYSTALRGNTDNASISLTTNSQSSTTTGAGTNMPPFFVVYVWRRVS